MIQGVQIELAGIPYTCPALSLGQVEVYGDRLSAYRGGMGRESVGLVIDVTHAALSRNYPDMTRAEVAEGIDLGSLGVVMDAVMGVSGLKSSAAAALPGEGQATANPIGQDSTPI